MRFNPFTRRLSMTKAELAAQVANAAATPLETISAKWRTELPRNADVKVSDVTRLLDDAARAIRRDGPTEVEVAIRDTGRFR